MRSAHEHRGWRIKYYAKGGKFFHADRHGVTMSARTLAELRTVIDLHIAYVKEDSMSTPRYPVSYSEARRLQQQGVLCECADHQCPGHKGRDCRRILHRIEERVHLTRADMDGARTTFCEECAADAIESGVFDCIG